MQKYQSSRSIISRTVPILCVGLVFVGAFAILTYSWLGVITGWARDTGNQTLTNKKRVDSPETLDSTRLEAVPGVPRYDRPETSIYRNRRDKSAGLQFQVFPVRGTITDSYGVRSNPFGFGLLEFHAGLDVAAPLGTPVVAVAKGMVTFSGWDGGYGNVVIIEHDNSEISTRYAHLLHRTVFVGQIVTGGTQIGLVGSTGRSTGPHLHYEVRVDGKTIDPLSVHSFK